MITKEQLQSMSDFEVNKALANIQPYTAVIGDGQYPSQSESAVHVEQRKSKYANVNEFGIDYCNNPSDIMPLAFEYGVYYYNGTACTAISDFIDSHVVFDEPYYFDAGRNLRAIACCLILVLQEKSSEK